MGCAPFENHHFQTGATILGFAEDLGHGLESAHNDTGPAELGLAGMAAAISILKVCA